MVTQSELKKVVSYDPETGIFTRIASSRTDRVGKKMGTKHPEGYLHAKIKGETVGLHRMAWIYVYGREPIDRIDHINGDPSDNRISNLRECSHSQNMQNIREAKSPNKSGYLGVSRAKGCTENPWLAQIQVNMKKIYLGCFPTPEAAHEAYLAKKREIHSFATI